MSDQQLTGITGEGRAPDTCYREILSQWDAGRRRGDFPHMGSDYHWAFGRARLSAFRSADEWLTIFELLTYQFGLGDFSTIIYAYGNRMRNPGLQEPGMNVRMAQAANWGWLRRSLVWALGLQVAPVPREAELMQELRNHGLAVPSLNPDTVTDESALGDDWWCHDPYDLDIVLNGTRQRLRLTPDDYARAGVDLAACVSGEADLDRIIHVFRVLCDKLSPEELFYSDDLLLECVGRPTTLPLFMRLNQWCNPGLGSIDRPSDSPGLRSLARALAEGRPEMYDCPQELVNTHWSQWLRWIS